MSAVRVYLPLTPAQIRALGSTRSLGPLPLTAYAVTPELSAAWPGEDQDALEHYALRAAATGDPARPADPTHRVLVAAADVEESTLEAAENAGHPAEVWLRRQVQLDGVVSFHVAEHPGVIGPGGDLLWYDVTELDAVLAMC